MQLISSASTFDVTVEGGRDPVSIMVLGIPRARRATSSHLLIAIYARYSDPSQKKDSIHRQVFSASRYIKEIGGATWTLFSDEGISASHANRDGLNKLFLAVRAGLINTIVIEDFDRLSREVYDAVAMIEELEKYGCKLHSAADGRPLSKEDAINKAIHAEKDRKRRAVVVTAGKYQMASKGRVPWGAFYGYDPTDVPGVLSKNADQADTISRIFNLAVDGVAIREISRMMRREGRVGPTGDADWVFNCVRRIIRNPLYAGQLYCGRVQRIRDRSTGTLTSHKRDPEEVLKVDVPELRIVDAEIWVKANTVIKGRDKRNGNSYAGRHPTSILPKHLTCDCPGVTGQCFRLVKLASGLQVTCNLSKRNGSCKAAMDSISADIVERSMVQALRGFLKARITCPTFVDEYRASLDTRNAERDAEKVRLRNLIAEKNGVLDRMFIADVNGRMGYSADRVQRNIASLEQELDMLKVTYLEVDEPLDVDAVQADRLLTVDAALETLERRLPFHPSGKVDHELTKVLHDLVPAIEIQRAGRPPGDGRLAISMNVSRLFGLKDHSAPNEVVHAVIKQRARVRLQRPKLEEVVASDVSRRYALPDEIWDRLVRALPARQATSKEPTPLRRILDIALLAMGMDISLRHLPEEVGSREQVCRAFLRFMHGGGVEILDRVVGRDHPAFPDGLPVHRFSSATRGLPALRSSTSAYEETITDAEWRVIADGMGADRKSHARNRTPSDTRHLLNVVLYKLRSRQPWHKVPYRDNGPSALRMAAGGLVSRGEWSKAESVMRERFPHLLDGAELWRMERFLSRAQRANRQLHDVHRDITDEEWSRVRHVLLGVDAGLRGADPRAVANGVLWISRNGRPWTDLPERYGKVHTAQGCFVKWRGNGVWDRVIAEIATLHAERGSDVRWIHSISTIKLNGRDRIGPEVIGWNLSP